MDSNNWLQSPQPEQPLAAVAGGDWRSQLTEDVRLRIINNILKACLPLNGLQDLQELQNIAIKFEERSFTAATDQDDYCRRILSKLNFTESRANAKKNAMPSNSAGMDSNPQGPAIQNVQSQVQNQDQSLPIPVAPIQNSAVQGLDSNCTNPDMQMQERQDIQHVSPQHQIQQSQNPQEYIYRQHQFRQQILKHDLHEGGTKHPLTQPHMQQQNIQMCSQPSVLQNLPPCTVLQQSQPLLVQQQDQQSIPETQIHVRSWKASVYHQTQMFQQPMLHSQQDEQQQQNQNTQLQQSQRLGQQNSILTMYHQQRSGSRSHVGQLPQQQHLLESQSSMLTNKHLEHIMQQPNFSVEQQSLNGGGQQHSQLQEMVLQMPSQMAQLQHQFVSQKKPNSLDSNMQHKIQTSNALHQQHNVIDQQKTFQSQRSLAKAPSTFSDSTAHNGNSSDWHKEGYQQMK